MIRRLLAALFLISTTMPALANDDSPQILTVGVEELDFYPLYSLNNGVYVGAGREILDAFAKDAGYEFRYLPLPIKRLYAELASGGIDLKFPDSPHWQSSVPRAENTAFTRPFLEYLDGVLVRPERVGRPEKLKTLGMVLGFTPIALMPRIQSNEVQVRENPRLEFLLRQVILERLDGGYASVGPALYKLKEMGQPEALVFDKALPHVADSYQMSSSTRPDVITQFNTWLGQNQSRITDIKRKFGITPHSPN